MRKNIFSTASLIVVAAMFVCVQNHSAFAAANKNASHQKYAVVDVKKVVNSSKSVKDLKKERDKQKEQVVNFVKKGNADVAAETDPVKKEALKKKLNNDLKYMTTTFDKRYKEGLTKINNDIGTDISNIGKERKYELILTTDAVLYGGEDITKELVKIVK